MNAKVAKRGANASACAPRRALLGSPLPEGAYENALRPGCGVPAPRGLAARGS